MQILRLRLLESGISRLLRGRTSRVQATAQEVSGVRTHLRSSLVSDYLGDSLLGICHLVVPLSHHPVLCLDLVPGLLVALVREVSSRGGDGVVILSASQRVGVGGVAMDLLHGRHHLPQTTSAQLVHPAFILAALTLAKRGFVRVHGPTQILRLAYATWDVGRLGQLVWR